MTSLFTIIKNKKERTWEKYLCNYMMLNRLSNLKLMRLQKCLRHV